MDQGMPTPAPETPILINLHDYAQRLHTLGEALRALRLRRMVGIIHARRVLPGTGVR